jgi:hypothetical protein
MPNREQLLTQLVEMLEQAQQTANEMNQQRLTRLVGEYNPETEQYEGGMFGQFGQTAREDVSRSATEQAARSRQSLISRGLGNTTILDTMRRGVEEDRLRALRDIEERVTQSRAGVIEGVTDAGPNMGTTAQLIQQLASVPDTDRQVTVGPTTGVTTSGGGGGPSYSRGGRLGRAGAGAGPGGSGGGGGASFSGSQGGSGGGTANRAKTIYPNKGKKKKKPTPPSPSERFAGRVDKSEVQQKRAQEASKPDKDLNRTERYNRALTSLFV